MDSQEGDVWNLCDYCYEENSGRGGIYWIEIVEKWCYDGLKLVVFLLLAGLLAKLWSIPEHRSEIWRI